MDSSMSPSRRLRTSGSRAFNRMTIRSTLAPCSVLRALTRISGGPYVTWSSSSALGAPPKDRIFVQRTPGCNMSMLPRIELYVTHMN